jgi:hypothetical protein
MVPATTLPIFTQESDNSCTGRFQNKAKVCDTGKITENFQATWYTEFTELHEPASTTYQCISSSAYWSLWRNTQLPAIAKMLLYL